MPRVAVASDTFNAYSNGDLVAVSGGNWTYVTPTNATANVSSGQVVGLYTSRAIARYTGAGTWVANQYAKATISNWAGTVARVGVIVRCSADIDSAADFYYATLEVAGPNTVIGKMVNGSDSPLLTIPGVPWTNGDSIEIEVQGTTLTVFRNGIVVGTATDPDLSGAPTDRAGILISDSQSLATIDNFEGGNLVGGGVLTASPLSVAATVQDATLQAGSVTYLMTADPLAVATDVAPSQSDLALTTLGTALTAVVSAVAFLRSYVLQANGIAVSATAASTLLTTGTFAMAAAPAQVFASVQDAALTHVYRITAGGVSIQADVTAAIIGPAVYRVATGQLVASATDNTPRANLTGLSWAWWDTSDIAATNSLPPVDFGANGSTDSAGVFRVELPHSTLAVGEIGILRITNSDGTITQNPPSKAFFGPVQVQ